MAVDQARVAVRKSLADYLRAQLVGTGLGQFPNLVVNDKWPTPQAAFPKQALTVIAPPNGVRAKFHPPMVWQVQANLAGVQGNVLYSYGVVEVDLQLDLWAEFESTRDSLFSAVQKQINRSVENTMATLAPGYFQFDAGGSLVIPLPDLYGVTAEYYFQPGADPIENARGAMTAEWRGTFIGTAYVYLVNQELVTLMKQVQLQLAANDAAPETISLLDAYGAQVQADNPEVWWRGDDLSGNIVDATFSHKDGTPSGTVTYQQAGLTQNGYGLLGSGARILLANPPEIGGAGSRRFSVKWWCQPSAVATGYNDVGSVAGAFLAHCLNANGDLQVGTDIGTAFTVPAVYKPGVAVCCVYTYDGAIGRFYVNGQLVAVAGQAPPQRWSSFAFGVGNQWNGIADEIEIYRSVLSPTRVLAHYNAGLGLVVP